MALAARQPDPAFWTHHARTLTMPYFDAISSGIPGYFAKDIFVGANNPVSVGSVAMTELSR